MVRCRNGRKRQVWGFHQSVSQPNPSTITKPPFHSPPLDPTSQPHPNHERPAYEYKSYPAALALPLVGRRALSLKRCTRNAPGAGAGAGVGSAAAIEVVGFLTSEGREASDEGGGGEGRLRSVDMEWGEGGKGKAVEMTGLEGHARPRTRRDAFDRADSIWTRPGRKVRRVRCTRRAS